MFKKVINTVKFLRVFVTLIRDPTRLDLVLALGDDMDGEDPLDTVPLLRKRPEAVRLFTEPLKHIRVDLKAMKTLPPGTLGRVFADQMEVWGLKQEDTYHTPVAPTNTAKFRIHMEQTHDLWHILTGFGTDVKGEIGLQAFYIAQLWTPLSFALVSVGFLHTLFYRLNEGQALVSEVARGWLLGKRSRPLFGVDWNELWSVPLDEVRRQFHLDVDAAHAAVPVGDLGDLPQPKAA
ncbi:hypothetical protein D7Y13_14090 [Corallococcus praedator]|uniref:Ubiquinone biosynthesis protein n=1 Tax=Corallococcus praedator TaxID=2316724 RepID=A0ABX9QK89_9BACT|nr:MULTISPECIES: Coq4 family protein [Corallococcus]RKH34079.1 hypothetical protein D7X75_09755 [Corallococcus sp. CA031C]RKI09594.1 hypothetical protein D7Y13_14090 [Corallococcus praedator]